MPFQLPTEKARDRSKLAMPVTSELFLVRRVPSLILLTKGVDSLAVILAAARLQPSPVVACLRSGCGGLMGACRRSSLLSFYVDEHAHSCSESGRKE